MFFFSVTKSEFSYHCEHFELQQTAAGYRLWILSKYPDNDGVTTVCVYNPCVSDRIKIQWSIEFLIDAKQKCCFNFWVDFGLATKASKLVDSLLIYTRGAAASASASAAATATAAATTWATAVSTRTEWRCCCCCCWQNTRRWRWCWRQQLTNRCQFGFSFGFNLNL